MTVSQANEYEMLEKLAKLLECPICFNSLTLPVALCRENGHAICKNCSRSVSNCPYCKSQWSPNRHILVEQLLQVLLHRCRFCHQFIPVETKEAHEERVCNKRVMQCFIFSRGGRCPGQFPRDSFWNHLYDKHGRRIWKIYLNETVIVPIKNVFATKNFCVLYEVGFSSPKRPNLSIVLRVFGDKEKKLLCFSVNVINGDVETEQYLFRFGIRRRNVETCSFVGPCIPLSCVPVSPDRYPGGHLSGRVVVPKSNHIFSDPSEHLYNFCLRIKKP